MKNWQKPFLVIALLAGVTLLFLASRYGKAQPLVVYCSHDSVYSEEVLRAFEAESGIPVEIRFDTEATKSLGLIELIIREADAPRCNVFWNNELLGMVDLHARGLLEPYQGPGWERIPAAFKEPAGHWAGFGARLRVVISNNDTGPADLAEFATRLEAPDLSRFAIAKPLYGTTLTHYCALWNTLGEAGLKAQHADWLARGLTVANGNGTTKNLVSEGVCDVGWTDTDDYFLARDAGKPVHAMPARLPNGKTISIPNTVGIIRGSQQQGAARKLVDYLLSEACEVRLANARSRQIPLGPVPAGSIPKEVQELVPWAAESTPLADLHGIRQSVIDWLQE
ncbi:MAG: iron(III) transport system substrate-binding protein [Rhodothermales bacterium]|jgi:iron(III) transport system substrate-binding protein